MTSDMVRLQTVSFAKIASEKTEAASRLSPGPGQFEKWGSVHESLKSVLAEYGTVSWDPDPLPDFYFSGDWFHENSDGFGICTSKSITKELLLRLPRVLAAHHKFAILEMDGMEPPIEGLMILVTSSAVLVGWQGLTRGACENRLRDVGIELV